MMRRGREPETRPPHIRIGLRFVVSWMDFPGSGREVGEVIIAGQVLPGPSGAHSTKDRMSVFLGSPAASLSTTPICCTVPAFCRRMSGYQASRLSGRVALRLLDD